MGWLRIVGYDILYLITLKNLKIPIAIRLCCCEVCFGIGLETRLQVQVNLDMTDHCTTDFCIWRTICLVPVWCISSIRHMYTTDFAYDGPIFLVPSSLSYTSSPVLITYIGIRNNTFIQIWYKLWCTYNCSLFQHRLVLCQENNTWDIRVVLDILHMQLCLKLENGLTSNISQKFTGYNKYFPCTSFLYILTLNFFELLVLLVVHV